MDMEARGGHDYASTSHGAEVDGTVSDVAEVEAGCKSLWSDCEEVMRLIKASIGRALEQSEKRNIATKATVIATALLHLAGLLNEQYPALGSITVELQQGVMAFIRKTKEIFNLTSIEATSCEAVETIARSRVYDTIGRIISATAPNPQDKPQEQVEENFMKPYNSGDTQLAAERGQEQQPQQQQTQQQQQQQQQQTQPPQHNFAASPMSPRMQEQATNAVEQVMKLMQLMITQGTRTEEVIIECKKTLPQLKALIQRAEELSYGKEEQELRAATYNFSITVKERLEGKGNAEDLTRAATELAEAIRGVMFARPRSLASQNLARIRADKFGTMPNRPILRAARPTAQTAVGQTQHANSEPSLRSEENNTNNNSDYNRRRIQSTYHTISPAGALNLEHDKVPLRDQPPRAVRPVSFAAGPRRMVDPRKPMPTEYSTTPRPSPVLSTTTSAATSTDATRTVISSSAIDSGTGTSAGVHFEQTETASSPTSSPTLVPTEENGKPAPLVLPSDSGPSLSLTTRPGSSPRSTTPVSNGSDASSSHAPSITATSSPSPLDSPATKSQPMKAVGEKVVNKKTVLLSATVSKSAFSPGETMALDINVNNQTKKVMKKVQMSLVKHAATYSIRKGGERKLESKNKVVVEKTKIAPGGGFPVKLNKEATEQVTFNLPQDVAPSVSDPRATFEVIYFLEVKLLPKGPELTLGPINIGEST